MTKLIVRLIVVATLSSVTLASVAPAAYAGDGNRSATRAGR